VRQPSRDGWRAMSSEERRVITSAITAAEFPGAAALLGELSGAMVSNSTPWILDVQVSPAAHSAVDLPDGPFPARAYVPSAEGYEGEIIVWLTGGHVSGLEYAWITSDPPSRWPLPDEMEVVAQDSLK